MSALKRKSGEQRREIAVVESPIKVAGKDSTATPSPALELQSALSLAFAPEPEVKKWSRPARIAILAGGAIVPWALIGLTTMLVTGALR